MSERYRWKTNTAYTTQFCVTNSVNALVTGLVNTDFGKIVYKDAAVSAQVCTVTEIGTGQYKAVYTPNTDGYWVLFLTNAANNPGGWQDDISTDQDGHFTIPSLMTTQVNTLETAMGANYKCLAGLMSTVLNKQVISGSTLSVKKTDNSTELYNATLTTTTGQAPIIGILPN